MATFSFAKYDGEYFSDTLAGDLVISTASTSNTIRMGINNDQVSSVQFSPGDVTFTNQLKLQTSNTSNFVRLKVTEQSDLRIEDKNQVALSTNIGNTVEEINYKLSWLQFDSNTNTISTSCNFGANVTCNVTYTETADSNLTVAGDFVTQGTATFSNALIAKGVTTLSNDLTVSGAGTIHGAATLSNDLVVAGGATVSNDINIIGSASVSNNLFVVGQIHETYNQVDSLYTVSTPITTTSNYYLCSYVQTQYPYTVSNVELYSWSEDLYSLRIYDRGQHATLYTSPWLSNQTRELLVASVNSATSQLLEVHARAVLSNAADNNFRIVNTAISRLSYTL